MAFTLDASTVTAFIAVVSWMTTNIFTVVLNKYLFLLVEFEFPLTLTAIHMLINTVGSLIAMHVLKIVPLVPIQRDKLFRNIVPLGAVFCFNIILGNISIRWVPVSFMQTVKSSVPAFTVLLQTFLGQYSSQLTYFSLVPVVGGVALATFTEVNFEIVGFTAALVASLTTSVQSIVSGVLLTGQLKLDSINLLYYMAPISLVLIVPFAYFKEFDALRQYDLEAHGTSFVLTMLFVSGAVAYLLNICVFFAIKSTSPLTFTVFGNLKVVLVIVISVMIFGNEVTWMNGVGCFIATAGIIWYNAIEYQAKEAKKLAMQAQQKKDEELADFLLKKDTSIEMETDSGGKDNK